jgi:hypothetical protein
MAGARSVARGPCEGDGRQCTMRKLPETEAEDWGGIPAAKG